MTLSMLNLMPALPEIFVLSLACVVLLVEAFSKKPAWSYTLTQVTLVGAGVITLLTAGEAKVYAFNGMFVDDLMAGRDPREWLVRAAETYRRSWQHAPAGSWGRPIGAIKARILAGDWEGAADDARCQCFGSPSLSCLRAIASWPAISEAER